MTTTEIKKKITENYLLGAIKHKGNISFFLEPIAYWIMDYATYDPFFKQEDHPEAIFRNNISVVNSHNVDQFFNSLEEDRIEGPEIRNYISVEGDRYIKLLFLIDFDSKTFISTFYDIEVETYIPSDWTGKFDDPLKFLPEEYSKIWE